MKKMILVDGNSLMYRAYFGMAHQANLTQNSKGLYTNAIYAFARMINTLVGRDYDNILVAFDAGKKTFRHEFQTDYKAGRSAMPDELRVQIAYIKEFLDIMRIKRYELPLYEADDIIGTLAKRAKEENYQVEIYSSDKDLLQLIDDNVKVILTRKGMSDLEVYTKESFYEKYQIHVNQFIDLKAMMGDKSDNLCGIPGIGEKKAVKYLIEYKDLNTIIEHAHEIKGADGEKIKNNIESALLCQKMATINCDSPIEVTIDDTVKHERNTDRLVEFYQELEFQSLLKEMSLKKVKDTDKDDYIVVSDPSKLNEILIPYSSLIFETPDYNYHKSPLLAIGIKNKMGNFILKPDMLYSSFDLQLFLEDENNHKSIFDYKRAYVLLKRLGYELRGVDFDLLLATYILNPSIAKEEFKIISDSYKYYDVYYDEAIYQKGAKKTIPSEEVYFAHINKKVTCLHTLKNDVIEKLTDRNQIHLLTEIEIPLSKVLGKMEHLGMKVDIDELNIQEKALNDRIEELQKLIYEISKVEFNIQSPKQLGAVLFEHLGLDCPKKTKSGYSTDIEVLESLRDKHEIIDLIIEYRQVTKLNSTYVAGLREQIYPDFKVHTIFQQALTQTGRLSSVEPNLQNIPIRTKEGHLVRKMFVPANQDNILFSADYSQIELRVLAHMADVKKLIEAFNTNEDIHSKTAKEVFGKTEITSEDRRRAKAVNFGIVYGISSYGLATDLGISNYEASNFIKKYMEIYPEIKVFMDDTIDSCKALGYVKTIKNRMRYIPDINSTVYQVREFAKRTAMNAPIQGSAADIMKIAMVNIDKEMEDRKLKSSMLLTVHDELVFEVYKEEEKIVEELVLRLMEGAVNLDVPLKADHSSGKNWYEVK